MKSQNIIKQNILCEIPKLDAFGVKSWFHNYRVSVRTQVRQIENMYLSL